MKINDLTVGKRIVISLIGPIIIGVMALGGYKIVLQATAETVKGHTTKLARLELDNVKVKEQIPAIKEDISEIKDTIKEQRIEFRESLREQKTDMNRNMDIILTEIRNSR
ncbi:hypothetical protein LCGC14_0435160 [marine sediment metagenome]|uniref:Uncharacterized protein n=1 Tax=marine sediment metagenome TaxID=412755 RepID=A0A0F9STF4_9ZZZZ